MFLIFDFYENKREKLILEAPNGMFHEWEPLINFEYDFKMVDWAFK